MFAAVLLCFFFFFSYIYNFFPYIYFSFFFIGFVSFVGPLVRVRKLNITSMFFFAFLLGTSNDGLETCDKERKKKK